MAEERYVDPNSGAAPQPGGYARVHVAESQAEPEVSVDAEEEPAVPDEPVEEPDSGDESSDGEDAGEGEGSSDYAELLSGTVAQVNEYLKDHADEKDAVVEAEKKGENRKGIVEG